MTRKARSINLSVTEQDKFALEQLANDLGMTWGGKTSISQLIKAIARQRFLITPNEDWPKAHIKALIEAQRALIDAGNSEAAQTVTELLLSRKEITIPQRVELQHFLDNPPPSWRQKLDQFIRSQTPFHLNYYDATDRAWSFHIRHAQINLLEKRHYLQCWCEETEGNQDLSELSHNRILRLDRIPEAAITPFKATWKQDLDRVDVEFHVFRGLIHAYRSIDKVDKINEIIAEPIPARRIVRSISNTFWFFREILPYGEDCEIIGPENIRQRFRQKVLALADRYSN